MKNNSITDYANCADFQYQIRNNFITEYAGYTDFQYRTRNNSITDYADYTDFRDYIKIIPLLTMLTTLISETTLKNNLREKYISKSACLKKR